MTLIQFLKELKKTTKNIDWDYCTDDDVPIRGYKGKLCYCPITAVVHNLTNEFYDIAFPTSAGWQIGLDPRDVTKIVYAADGKRNTKLRRQLMEALGIE